MTGVALVVGGSRGIGRACAVELARRGAEKVLIGYLADHESANAAAEAVEA
ncbi:MAG: short chain dehydrogenase, partial [Acidimicrobiaceae bacterium]|nr:short chain dehydrogenase [Acidimicrobiaceae bacterium]